MTIPSISSTRKKTMDKPKDHMSNVYQKKQRADFSEIGFHTQQTFFCSPCSIGASGLSKAISVKADGK